MHEMLTRAPKQLPLEVYISSQLFGRVIVCVWLMALTPPVSDTLFLERNTPPKSKPCETTETGRRVTPEHLRKLIE